MISRKAKKLVPAREQLQALTPAELTEVSGGGGGWGGDCGRGWDGDCGRDWDGDWGWGHHHRHHHHRHHYWGYGTK